MRERMKSDVIVYADKKSGDLNDACYRYSLGRNRMRELAEEAGAVVKIGTRLLINFTRMDAYIDQMTE